MSVVAASLLLWSCCGVGGRRDGVWCPVANFQAGNGRTARSYFFTRRMLSVLVPLTIGVGAAEHSMGCPLRIFPELLETALSPLVGHFKISSALSHSDL